MNSAKMIKTVIEFDTKDSIAVLTLMVVLTWFRFVCRNRGAEKGWKG